MERVEILKKNKIGKILVLFKANRKNYYSAEVSLEARARVSYSHRSKSMDKAVKVLLLFKRVEGIERILKIIC